MAVRDQDGCTPLTMAVMSGNVECIREVLRVAARQYVKPKSNKPKRAPARDRLDNFELMNDGSDDDYEDEDDDDDEEDDDEEEKPAKTDKSGVPSPGQSSAKPEELFLMTASVFLESSPIYQRAVAFRNDVERLKGRSNIMERRRFHTHIKATPLQLAIVLGDCKAFEALLEEAEKISPSLLRSILLHDLTFVNHDIWSNTIGLIVKLDRVEMLQTVLSRFPVALAFESIASRLQVIDWTFELVAEEDALDEAKRKKKNQVANQKSKYPGIQSVLFGLTRMREEMKRDPRLAGMDRSPNPQQTLLHVAATAGAPNCYKRLLRGFRDELETSLLPSKWFPSVKEMLTKARERTPKAFESKSDIEMIETFLLGRDETLGDDANRTPLHCAVLSGTLVEMIETHQVEFPQARKDYREVTLDDKIRFSSVRETALGELTPGGSPLSLACFLDDADAVRVLIDRLGFDPNLPDGYYYGMNPFHLALLQKSWKAAREVAKRIDPGRLLEVNEFGITPLMTAAKAGTVEGLMAAMSVLDDKSSVPQSSAKRDGDGRTALHFAANSRFAETMRTILDWTVEQNPANWFAEEFASGRTPLDDAIAVVIAKEMSASQARKGDQTKRSAFERRKQAQAVSKSELEYQDRFENGRQVVQMLERSAEGKSRVRALFSQVRPVREKRMDAVATADSSDKVAKLKEDFAAVWSNVHQTGRNHWDRMSSTSGRYGVDVLHTSDTAQSTALFVVSLSASS